jgi:hypothetical protein
MTARQIALAHLRLWMTAAEGIPAGAAWLEPVDALRTTSWAVRHPSTGALFGWHADPERLAALYWETLGDDDRCELVAQAVGALRDGEHRLESTPVAWPPARLDADGSGSSGEVTAGSPTSPLRFLPTRKAALVRAPRARSLRR